MTKKKLSESSTRKRANVKKENAAVPNKDNLRAITQMEAQMFQQLIQISNQYAKLKQQKQEFETVLTQVKKKREQVAKGEISLPVFLPLGKNKMYQCSDKKEILTDLDAEIKVLTNAVKGIDGQLKNHQDAYVEAGLAIRDFADRKFSKYKPKNVYSKGCNPKKEEKIIFEGELDDILKNEEKKEELSQAIKKAEEENKKKEK